MAVSVYVIAAMCGCWYRESGVNPGIWESLVVCDWNYQYEYTNKGGYGLGQWTNVGTTDGRLYHLHRWVTSNGYTDGDGEGQLNYLTVEGYWNGDYNGTGDHAQTRGSYGSLSSFLNSTSTSISDLVWDFLANWEGVPGNAYDERLEWANKFLTYLQEHGGESASWTSVNNYLSETQSYQNALCVYNFFSGYAPEPPAEEHRLTVSVRGRANATVTTGEGETEETILEAGYNATVTSESIEADTELTLTIETDGKYKVKKIEVTEGDITLTEVSKNKVYTFTFPDENVTIVITIVKPFKWWMYMRPKYKWYQ